MKRMRFRGFRWLLVPVVAGATLLTFVYQGTTAEKTAVEGGGNAEESALVGLLGATLVRANGDEVETKSLEGKMVALYFSALWCPPCRAFSPRLVEVYDEWQKQEEKIELVFVSFDRTKEAQTQYMTEYKMKWLAVPYEGAKRQELGTRFSVRGIPALLVLDAEGRLISRNGVQEVGAHGTGALARWRDAAAQQ